MQSSRAHVAASLVAVAVLLVGRVGLAEVVGGGGDVPPVSHAPSGQRAVKRGVQAPAGMFHARVLLHVNASKDNFGKPTSLAPDLFYAISDSLQIGLLHNLPMGWQTLPGAGLCLTGTTKGCPHVYDNVGFDLMYGLAFGDFHFSIHSSLYLLAIADPTWVMWTIGAAGKLHLTDAVAIFFDPQIGVALNHRDATPANPLSNEDMLFFPAELQFQAGERVSLKVLTGVWGELANLGDTYRVPLGVGFIRQHHDGIGPRATVQLRQSPRQPAHGNFSHRFPIAQPPDARENLERRRSDLVPTITSQVIASRCLRGSDDGTTPCRRR